MICLFLDTGVSSILKQEILESHEKEFDDFVHIPSCFLKINGKSIIDQWWDVIMKDRRITSFYILTCALKYKAYERWATAKGLPISHVINNGNTMDHADVGDCANIVMALSKIDESYKEILIIGNKNLCIADFNISCPVSFQEIKQSDVVLYSNQNDVLNNISVDSNTKRVLSYGSECTENKFSSPNLFFLVQSTLELLKQYVYSTNYTSNNTLADFIYSICSSVNIYGMYLQVPLIYFGGNTSLSDYHSILNNYNNNSYQAILPKEVLSRSYARVGLMGNPSDGFYGKTLACTIQNFWAEVQIVESDTLKLIPHPLYDPMEFDSLTHLYINSKREGYYGGMRLLTASCKCFYEYCTNNGIYLHPRKFNLSYDTNIPRQVGLAGSSAIVSAVLKSLMKFYGVTEDIFPLYEQPNWTLNVETKELGITAGLQDRVVQLYEGLVYMDFDRERMERDNHGIYKNLDVSLLPPLFLAYCAQPKDSGKVHSQVKQQWLNGDKTIDAAMKEFASYTDLAVDALNTHDYDSFKQLFNKNFQLRRKIFGDAVIKQEYIHMVDIASQHDGAAKFPGSGGAVVGTCSDEKMKEMKRAYEEEGYVFVRIIPYTPK